ncbi:B3GT4 galactosyltransferase, partial [Turnix velox]|nr:B3GT4 galactosyltransferase [Turnix velox]
LGAESQRFGDILQGPFWDTYKGGLRPKTHLLLRWAHTHCPSPFLLKADDDVFINIPALISFLMSSPLPPLLYMGRLHLWVRPQRDPGGRHHVPPQ